jgi:mannose-6-phosphate isomerase
VHVVRGVVKDYDWGRIDGLASWSGDATGGPQAELWFGAHPAGPSPVLSAPGGASVLSDHLAAGDAPLLVKLLAAGAPLSLQVHPDAAHSAAGFARQQARGPQAPEVFADGREKTEMLVALEGFEALAGWRDTGLAADVLAGAGLPAAVVARVRAGDRGGAVAGLLAMGDGDCRPMVARLPGAGLAAGLPAGAVAALGSIVAAYPDDAGTFVSVLLNHVQLAPGDAVFVPAGVPHSYIRGLGVEVMTSSDNVLRLGLTRKLVSVPDAVAAFRPDRQVSVVRGSPEVAPAGAPFMVALRRNGTWPLPGGRYRVVVAVDGPVVVRAGHVAAALAMGRAAVLPATDPGGEVEVAGLAAVVTERALDPAALAAAGRPEVDR